MTWRGHKEHSVRVSSDAKSGDQLISVRTGLLSGGIWTSGRKGPMEPPCTWGKSSGQMASGSFMEKALGPQGKPAEQGQGGWQYENGQTVAPKPKELVMSPSLEDFQPVSGNVLNNPV